MARTKSTFEKGMEDKGFKQKFEKEYKRFSLSETVLGLMEKKRMSVRKLAKAAQLSPTIIQELRSGGRKQLAFATALQIISALDCKLEVVDGKNHIPLVKT